MQQFVKQNNLNLKEKILLKKITKLEDEILQMNSSNNPIVNALKSKHEAEIQILNESHQNEIESLQKMIQSEQESSQTLKRQILQFQRQEKSNQQFKKLYYEQQEQIEQLKKTQNIFEQLKSDNDKQTNILTNRTKELTETQSILKEKIINYELQISGKDKQIQLLEEQLTHSIEIKDKEIAELQLMLQNRDKQQLDDSCASELHQSGMLQINYFVNQLIVRYQTPSKGLGAEFLEMLQNLEQSKTIEHMTKKIEQNKDLQALFDQQDIDVLKSEKETTMNFCKQMKIQLEEQKVEIVALQGQKQQLISQLEELKSKDGQNNQKIKDQRKEFKIEAEKEKLKLENELKSLNEKNKKACQEIEEQSETLSVKEKIIESLNDKIFELQGELKEVQLKEENSQEFASLKNENQKLQKELNLEKLNRQQNLESKDEELKFLVNVLASVYFNRENVQCNSKAVG